MYTINFPAIAPSAAHNFSVKTIEFKMAAVSVKRSIRNDDWLVGWFANCFLPSDRATEQPSGRPTERASKRTNERTSQQKLFESPGCLMTYSNIDGNDHQPWNVSDISRDSFNVFDLNQMKHVNDSSRKRREGGSKYTTLGLRCLVKIWAEHWEAKAIASK